VNGTVISGPELSFSVALDKPLYYADFMPPVDPSAMVEQRDWGERLVILPAKRLSG